MPTRSLFFTTLLFLFLLPETTLFAQQKGDTVLPKKTDTLIVNPNIITDSSGKGPLAQDTSEKNRFNPRQATFRSMIVPGWGQLYNKKYWKIPIIYGGLVTTTVVFLFNLKYYKILRQDVIYSLGDATQMALINPPQLIGFSTASLELYRNAYRQDIDYSVLVFLIIWGLNIVDATVDAHLKGFDVSPDVGMRIQPGFNYGTSGASLSLVFSLKDKSSKPLLPLP